MEIFTTSKLLYGFAGALLAGLAAWIWKYINKLTDNADKAGQSINAEQARKITEEEIKKIVVPQLEAIKVEQEDGKKDLAVVKSDVKQMGISILDGVESQGNRLDQLFMHLLSTNGEKNNG